MQADLQRKIGAPWIEETREVNSMTLRRTSTRPITDNHGAVEHSRRPAHQSGTILGGKRILQEQWETESGIEQDLE